MFDGVALDLSDSDTIFLLLSCAARWLVGDAAACPLQRSHRTADALHSLIPRLCGPFDSTNNIPLALNINPKKYLKTPFSACQYLADEAPSLPSEQK